MDLNFESNFFSGFTLFFFSKVWSICFLEIFKDLKNLRICYLPINVCPAFYLLFNSFLGF